MRILGISPLDKDSTVSFVEDGRVLFACGEERLSRKKLQDGFPERALKLGLQRTGWQLSDIDVVAYPFFEGSEEERLIRDAAAQDRIVQSAKRLGQSSERYQQLVRDKTPFSPPTKIPGLDDLAMEFMPAKTWSKSFVYERAARSGRWDLAAHRHYFNQWIDTAIHDHHQWSDLLTRRLGELGIGDKLQRFQHHDTHAANSFYASGFADSLVVVLDGYGSGCCGAVYTADKNGIQCLHRYKFPYSLGIFYEQVTSALGFRPSRHEGKIVGLASYGDPQLLGDLLYSRFLVEDGDIKILGAQNVLFGRALAMHFSKRDVAAAYQYVLEKVAVESLRYWQAKTGLKRLVMSGGVHANVKLNQRLFEIDGIDSAFVYPNMGDGGCATGAALLALGNEKAGAGVAEVSNVYYGPDYSENEIQEALDAENLEYEQHDEIEQRIAEVLSENHIVARFNGRMEYGPRALGNRSILYHAREPEVNQWLNNQLGRTEFMPFAPACLGERANDLFIEMDGCEKTSEYMTITFDCTDEMKRHSPAAVHIDGTARPQLVTPESNESFYKILAHYESLTSIPVLINTSFNMHEEPIVCSPADAVRAFLLGNIDYLAIGSCLVPHPNLAENTKQRKGEYAFNAI
ncbi:Decarbamoylnovobiocin carbamoyltransferase [Rubripirellula amarantea]|uniref:Decarbamoylnovobiocin carbamoyltransferase n=1 Tax=Rubripirellula amarantea TaxID=2527999 RepID=A0A5C5WVI8_9BACT|nr:carbamoyltransferase C-terminal domain-containing protein [Rubripirellula amarantea]TWT54676.1 Decarbamoylnovobiocin carbamoyltransferase [Rubripirellula amarantea]